MYATLADIDLASESREYACERNGWARSGTPAACGRADVGRTITATRAPCLFRSGANFHGLPPASPRDDGRVRLRQDGVGAGPMSCLPLSAAHSRKLRRAARRDGTRQLRWQRPSESS
jgi:hypothetical protein